MWKTTNFKEIFHLQVFANNYIYVDHYINTR